MKYIYAIAFLLSAAYLMKMPVEESKPPVIKQVKKEPFSQEWEQLLRRAEYMTGMGYK